MRFDCGPTYQEKKAKRDERERLERVRLADWHPYFAICRTIAPHDCRVLEWVERKRITHTNPFRYIAPYSSRTWYTYEYRARP